MIGRMLYVTADKEILAIDAATCQEKWRVREDSSSAPRVNRGAAYLEATELAGFSDAEARRLFGRDPGLPPTVRADYLMPWSAAKAEKRFLARFNALQA